MDLLAIKHKCRSNFNVYLNKALNSINNSNQLNVLDIGCGTGVSVLEIAKKTNWQITAVEPDENCLLFLNIKIQELNLTNRIKTFQSSIKGNLFAGKKFDLILAEGLFNIIGFNKGLTLCSSYLTSNGYLLIHDEITDKEKKLKLFQDKGFNLITSILLDEKIWWDQYYSCLEKKIQQNNTPEKHFKQETGEIEMYKKNPQLFQSIYYVVQKI